ncbi:MAG: aminotransferase [Proteobacteria bacterium]|nr:aminotransferase [Pseudomonadota bacterium]
MEKPVCKAFRPFGTSIFTEMTILSNRSGAINLSQGFPDFDGPDEVKQAAVNAILNGSNQYAPSMGVPSLRKAVAAKLKRFHGIEADPETQVTVTSGATEGLTASLLGILEAGDEVIVLEPCYDLYPPMIARAGAKAVYVPLKRPGFTLPEEALKKAFGPRTRAIMINNPLNPCGKVFSRDELELIGALCKAHNAIAIGDEVYEHLVYDDRSHVTLISVPDLKERSIVVSSTAKTFSMTGWKIGYAVASPLLTQVVRMSHQFITYCTPPALQEAMAHALGMGDNYYEELLRSYTQKRELLCNALSDVGFDVLWPEGTYYVTVDISELDFEDDMEFCRYLTTEVGVAAIPESSFFAERRGGRNLVRFCFCKKEETLEAAAKRLKRWRK